MSSSRASVSTRHRSSYTPPRAFTDPVIGRSIAEVIRRHAPHVETEVAHDGFEAGGKVESFRPHALVLDMAMPGVDGMAVCRRLRERPTLNHIRIVAITRHSSAEDIERMLAAGADACLPKPLDSDRLVAELGLLG